MQPNFEAMTVMELRQYAIAHRGDDSQDLALREMLNRRDSITLNFPESAQNFV